MRNLLTQAVFLTMVVGNTLGYLLFTIIIGDVILSRYEDSNHHHSHSKHLQYDRISSSGGVTTYEESEHTNIIEHMSRHAANEPTKRHKDQYFS
jgi:hypothetical protein